MTADHSGDDQNAEVITLPAADAGTEARLAESDGPAYVALGDGEAQRRAIVPDHWRTREAARRHLQLMAARHGHAAAYHGVRLPGYLGLTVAWSVVGIFRTSRRVIRWWHTGPQAEPPRPGPGGFQTQGRGRPARDGSQGRAGRPHPLRHPTAPKTPG